MRDRRDVLAARPGYEGLDALTLATFKNVAWNAPYYARWGFETVAPIELGPDLQHVRAEEAARGLQRYERVVLRKDTGVWGARVTRPPRSP